MKLEWTPVDPRYTHYLQLHALVVMGVIAIVIAAQYFIARWGAMLPSWLWSAGILLALTLLLTLLWAPRRFLYTGYCVTDDLLLLRQGALWRAQRGVPFNRIQHVEVKESLFARLFGLASVVIYTAGSQGADLEVPGLRKVDAEAMQHRLLNEMAQQEFEGEGDDI